MPSWEPPYPTPHWRLRKFFSQPTNWEPPRPVLVYGYTYALTDEVREKFPSSGLHLIPREERGDLVVPEFTGYEDPREAEKWITAFCEWTIMNGMSQGLCQELLAEYIKRALRHIPHHPLMKKTFESWEDLLRDFFLDMKIRGLEKYKAWYWLKRKDVPIIWFSHTELKLATNYFDSSFIVGESDMSRLIKGFMHGNTPVVVKRLKKVVDTSIQKVLNEINVHRYLTKDYHGDVCRLLGYSTCAEDPLLVYEYIPNGNLREHMQERYGYGDYIWQNAPCRLAILIDIASGIGELHYNSKLPVYHRDIQPSNILLDKNYRAKICDFGDAVVIKSEEDRHKHPVCGALGYLDPVFRATGRCDDKTDVYSLGVIMLELATKLKAWDPFRQSKYGMNPFLLGFMMERMKDGTAEEYLRPGRAYYIGTPHNMEGTAIVIELVRVALWCCCPELRLRPRADQVATVLLQIQSRWVTPGLRAIQQTTEGGVMPTLAGQQDDIPLGEKRPPEREKPVFFMKLPESAVKLEPQAVKKLQPNLEALQRNDPPKVLPVGKGQVEPQSQAPETPLGKDQPKPATQNQPKTLAGKQPATDQPKTSPPPAKDQVKIPAGKKTAKEGKIST